MAKNQEKKDEKAIEEGQNAIRRQYYGTVRATAKEILKEAREQYEDYDDAHEFISDRVHEEVDGNYWVIYTHANLQVLYASDNWLAIDDMDDPAGRQDGFTTLLMQAAYYAMEADVQAQIEAEKDDYFREENPRRAPKAAKPSAIKNKLLR